MTKQKILNKHHFASNVTQKKSNFQTVWCSERFIRRMRHFQTSCGVPKKSQAIQPPSGVIEQNIFS